MKFKLLAITDKLYFGNESPDDLQKVVVCQNYLKKYFLNSKLKVLVRENTIKFWGPIFRYVWNGFNVINNVSSGFVKIDFTTDKKFCVLEYNFYFYELFVIYSLFSLIAFLGIFPNNFYRVLYFVGVYLIYFINVLITSIFFEKSIKKNLKNLGIQIV